MVAYAGFPLRRPRKGVVTSFVSGAQMDAQARVGGVYDLIGATTRAVIATLKCVAVGPLKYELLGAINWYQGDADGKEYSGVFKPVGMGVATFGWGASPGARGSAGLVINGDGAIRIAGLKRLGATASVQSWIKILTLNLTAGRGIWSGFVRDADLTLASIAGLGATATPSWACVAAVAQSLPSPTLTPNTTFAAPPSTSVEQLLWARLELSAAGGTSQFARGGITDQPGQSQPASVATGALAGAGTYDRSLIFGGRGCTFCVKTTEFVGATQ